jgi:hypothetical protein
VASVVDGGGHGRKQRTGKGNSHSRCETFGYGYEGRYFLCCVCVCFGEGEEGVGGGRVITIRAMSRPFIAQEGMHKILASPRLALHDTPDRRSTIDKTPPAKRNV